MTGPDAPWKEIVHALDDVTAADLRGSTIYLLSHKDAGNYKVLAMSLAAPDFAAAKTLVAPSRAVIEQIAVAADGLYVSSRIGGSDASRVCRWMPTATLPVPPPP